MDTWDPYHATGAAQYGGSPHAINATYMIDDGTAEDSIGLTAGGTFTAANLFAVTGGNNIITSIEIAWVSPRFPIPVWRTSRSLRVCGAIQMAMATLPMQFYCRQRLVTL